MGTQEEILKILSDHQGYEWWPTSRVFICTCEVSLGSGYPDAAHKQHLAEVLTKAAGAEAAQEAAVYTRPLKKPWHVEVEARGGEWRLLTADGDIIADGIPHRAYAEHIVKLHNTFLDVETHVEERMS